MAFSLQIRSCQSSSLSRCSSVQLLTKQLSSARLQQHSEMATIKDRSLSNSLSSAMSCPTRPSLQDKASSHTLGVKEEKVRPYSDIPRAKTFLGINFEIMKSPTKFVEYNKRQTERLGNIYVEKGIPGLDEFVLVTDPADIEKVFRVADAGYPERISVDEMKRSRKELHLPFGMFLENGEKWHSQRMPISKFIMMPRKMAEYHLGFNAVGKDYIDFVCKKRGKDDLLSDVTDSLNKWSFESVSFFVLGKRLGCLREEMPPDVKKFADSNKHFLETTNDFMFGIPFHKFWNTKKWREYVKSFDNTYSYASSLIREKFEEIEKASGDAVKKEAEVGMDFLTYMIHSGKMNLEEITVNAIDMLTAGIDSTSLTMTAGLYALGTHPEIQEKLRQEVESVVGREEVVTPQHIQEMHYLRDCLKESQRLHPIESNHSRFLKEDVVLSGYHVPAGTLVLMCTALSGRLPELFPEPDEFKPERWSRENAELPHPFASLPFGYGRRGCVGRRVAELEMHILLAHLMKNFKIEYHEEKPLEFINKPLHGPGRQLNLAFTSLNQK